ncbi:MAG: putative toxin-antitoxin system toxin component, PIN family [Thaumarchaeota archaeon]|nr:putative toxin-antitoxin system toxin component, PIN family [Nitrososphaerota archaeon]
MRIVVDTNVLVSALVGHGKPRQLLVQLLERHEVVTSSQMLAELADVLAREKFKQVGESHVNAFLSVLASAATVVVIKHRFDDVSDDPDDNVVLGTAYDGRATYIVSGDRHLLDLRRFRGIEIVTVREVLELLKQGL